VTAKRLLEDTPASWFTVEGPDGAGKSTIVKTLAHALAYRSRPVVLQTLYYDSDPGSYVIDPMHWVDAGLHVVQDRGALSGPVYEPLFRGDMDRLKWLDPLVEEAAVSGALLIYVYADVPRLMQRVEERGDDYITPDRLYDIEAGYKEALDRWDAAGGARVDIDTTDEFPDELMIKLKASLLMATR
jgi:thymidylate kinase